MGLKTQTILVRSSVLDGGPDKLLADLGYEKRRNIRDVPFSHSGSGSIWLGSINNCVVIYTHFAWAFFEEDQALDHDSAFFKNALLRHFSEADVAALTLNSVVDSWGFAFFQNGAQIRRQQGSADEGIVCDEGSPLPVESDSDLGKPMVQEICRSFTGYPLDAPELGNVVGTDFWLNDDESKILATRARIISPTRNAWWKFWAL